MIITISGNPGSGKSTLAKYLAKIFKLEFYSIGDIRRGIALKQGKNINELNKFGEKNFITDKVVDDYLKTLVKKRNIIVDGRMAFHFIPDSIKIFVKVDLREGAKRIFKKYRESEHYKTIEEAHKTLEKRLASDDKRYRKYYGINIFDLTHYDIIFDSTNMSLNEAKKTIKKSVEKYIKA
jgi:cytidylate kinase